LELSGRAQLSADWRPEAVVYAIGPVGGRNGGHEFHDLLGAEVAAQGIEVDVVDVARMAGQQVGEPKDRLLFDREDIAMPPASGLLQRVDLLIGQSSPLPRSGVAARSIVAAVQDRSAEVGQLLQVWTQGAVIPDCSVELGEGAQKGGLVGQDLVKVRHPAEAFLKRAVDPLDVGTGLLGLDRLYPHGKVTPLLSGVEGERGWPRSPPYAGTMTASVACRNVGVLTGSSWGNDRPRTARLLMVEGC
jgi:hypothetical protein